MNRWTNVRYDRQPAIRKSDTSGRKDEYPAGPFPWTEQQAHACFAAHGWGGGDCLLIAMRNAWANPRPACYPPHEVMDAETAVAVALAKWAEVRALTHTINGQMELALTKEA